MPTTPGPRTQTGLVPTSYQLQINRLNSSENWKSLPPRPPPERFPYRGDGSGKKRIVTRRKQINSTKTSLKKSTTKKKQQERPSRKSNRGTIHTSTNKEGLQKRKQQEWNTRTERELPGLSNRNDKEKEMIKGQTLEYIRKSARRRSQLDELQKRLDNEITQENRLYGFDAVHAGNDNVDDSDNENCDRDYSEEDNDNDEDEEESEDEEDNYPMLQEMDRLKMTFLRKMRQLEREDSDDSADEDIGSDSPSLANSEQYFHNEQQKIQYSLGDASTLGSVGTSIASVDDFMSKQFNTLDLTHGVDTNSIVRNAPEKDMSASTCTMGHSSEGGITTMSKDSAWDNLSHDQHCRIRTRSQELYVTKFKPCNKSATDQKSVSCSPMSIETGRAEEADGDTLDPLYCHKPKEESKGDSEKNQCDENTFSRFEIDNSCASDLITAITDGLFPTNKNTICETKVMNKEVHVEKDKEGEVIMNKTIHVGDQNEQETSRENFPETAQKPRHPYKLPLKSDIRNKMKKENE
jgi:hypothetical protein